MPRQFPGCIGYGSRIIRLRVAVFAVWILGSAPPVEFRMSNRGIKMEITDE